MFCASDGGRECEKDISRRQRGRNVGILARTNRIVEGGMVKGMAINKSIVRAYNNEKCDE